MSPRRSKPAPRVAAWHHGWMSLRRELDERWRSSVKQWWDKAASICQRVACSPRRARAQGGVRVALGRGGVGSGALYRGVWLQRCGDGLYTANCWSVIPNTWARSGVVGSCLLARDDPQGIDQLSAAARIDPKLEQPACAAVVGFHRRHGREVEAKEYERRLLGAQRAGRARPARAGQRAFQRSLACPTGSMPRPWSRLHMVVCNQVGGVKRALLVRKALRYHAGAALCSCWASSRTPRGGSPCRRAAEKELVARISRECHAPGDTLIVSLRLNSAFPRAVRPGPRQRDLPPRLNGVRSR